MELRLICRTVLRCLRRLGRLVLRGEVLRARLPFRFQQQQPQLPPGGPYGVVEEVDWEDLVEEGPLGFLVHLEFETGRYERDDR